jgi:hypothetical protein
VSHTLGPPGDDAAPGGSSSEGRRADEQQRAAGNRSVVMVAEPRWCRFTTTWCRCGVEHLESANMAVCAAHFLHDSVEVA